MRKKLLSLFLAFCMAASMAVPASAAVTTSSSKEMSIQDVAKADGAYVTDITVSEDGSVEMENGTTESFNSYFDVSFIDRIGLRSAETREEYLEDKGYDVAASGDGDLTVTDMFQTARLYTDNASACNKYGAESWAESNGLYFIQYKDSDVAKKAYDKLQADGVDVYPDKPMKGLDSYQFVVDQLGQYGKTFQFQGTLNGQPGTIDISTSGDLMGLIYAGRNTATAQTTTNLSEVNVAVIDSGIDTSNAIFNGRTLPGYSAVGGSTTDTYGHGTHVASIILNNTPSNVKVIPVKITDINGAFTASSLAAGLAWCATNTNTVDLINASVSINSTDSSKLDMTTSALDAYVDALYTAGISIVTSAGNVGADGNRSADLSYPGMNEKTICVSNITNNSNGKISGSWTLASNSKYGNAVDFCAPGTFIRGVQATGLTMTETDIFNGVSGSYISIKDGTSLMTGTSQSCAMVSAALANVLSYDKTISVSEQLNVLKKCATKSGLSGAASGKDTYYGYGYPDMTAYVHNANTVSDGVQSGLVTDWDVQLNQSSGICYLRKYTGSSANVTLPATVQINGKTYTVALGASTQTSGPFQNNKNIASINIPVGMNVENGDASYLFYNCSKLLSVNNTPANATNAAYIFYGDGNLSGTIAFPSDNVATATQAFYGIKNTLLLTCTSGSLTEKTLLAELASEKNASVKINGKSYSDSDVKKDTEVITKKEITDFDASFNDTAKTVILTKYKGSSPYVVIPNSYVLNGTAYNVIIGKSTENSGPFNNNATIQSVTISGNVRVEDNDGRYMFYKCTNLKTLSCIPDGATDISYICYMDSSLNPLPTVPVSVTKMDYAFYGCKGASGTQTVASDNVASASGAYIDDKLTIRCKADTLTYKTLSAELANWTGVTLDNGSNTTIGDNTIDENATFTVTFHYRNKKANKLTNENVKKASKKYGSVVKEPSMVKIKAPNKYTFSGWYTKKADGSWEKYNFTNPITDDTEIYARWSYVGIKKPVIKSIKTNGSKKVKIKYKKLPNVSGYHISYCHHDNFQNAGNISVKDPNKLSYNIKLISGGKTYVKIRGWKKVNGVKYYGPWSKVMYITVK